MGGGMMTPETIEKIKAHMALASVFEEDLEESFILGSGPQAGQPPRIEQRNANRRARGATAS